jgi:hypothetical protein
LSYPEKNLTKGAARNILNVGKVYGQDPGRTEKKFMSIQDILNLVSVQARKKRGNYKEKINEKNEATQ